MKTKRFFKMVLFITAGLIFIFTGCENPYDSTGNETSIAPGGDTIYSFVDSTGNTVYVDAADFSEANLLSIRERGEISPAEASKTAQFTELLKQKTGRFWSTPDEVSWAQYQTGIRNQKNRNLCSCFGIIAGIEARYKRDHGISLDLSEQYFWHVLKSTTLSYPKIFQYENQSSYWGGGNPYCINKAEEFSICKEIYAPYKDADQMEDIRDSIPGTGDLAFNSNPALNNVTQANVDAFEYSTTYISNNARYNAKYGVEDYILLSQNDTRNTAVMELYLAYGYEVITGFNLKWIYNPATGIYEYNSKVVGAGHCMLVIGYNKNEEYFLVKNSWGQADFIKVSYEFMERCSSGGSIVTGVSDPATLVNPKGRMLGEWKMDHDGWKGTLIIRRTTDANNTATRFGHYYRNGQARAVNGYTINNGRGIRFCIASVEENEPGTMSGQSFYIDVYSWDIRYAAGYTSPNGTPYGVLLNKTGYIAPYGNNFTRNKWYGIWDMNHDGWQGELRVYGFWYENSRWNVTATYVTSGGENKTVSGYLWPGKEHVLQLYIWFSSPCQPFTLHYHTWDEDLFSGYTMYNGHIPYGTHGIKR